MDVAELVLEDGEEVGDDVEAVGEEADALVHLEVAPDGAVDGLEPGLGPHQLRPVQHAALQVDVDAQDEQLADPPVDLPARQVHFAGARDLFRQRLRRGDGAVEQRFVERRLGLRARACRQWGSSFFFGLKGKTKAKGGRGRRESLP